MDDAHLALSVVVVAYDMERELPRSLRSLLAPYQRSIDASRYEVIVVDNGSLRPVLDRLPPDLADQVRVHRIDDAAASPARAANLGIEAASGDVIGLVIDGARMASPGLLAEALRGAASAERAVVTAPAWHLGLHPQSDAPPGRGSAAEDALLAQSAWEEDGYALFEISSLAPSSGRGLFGPMGESSSLFLGRELWSELGGLDEQFTLPGGGLVNHDLYRRACALTEAQLVVLLGEGTFHQIHGGAATSGRVTRAEMWADYESIRGDPHRPPLNRPLYIGTAPPQFLPHLARSLDLAARRQSGSA